MTDTHDEASPAFARSAAADGLATMLRNWLSKVRSCFAPQAPRRSRRNRFSGRSRVNRRMSGAAIERLEDRTLLSVNFVAGPLAVPLTNRADVGAGLTAGGAPIEPTVVINPTDPGNIAISSHSVGRISTDAGGAFGGNFFFTNPAGTTTTGGDTDMIFDSQGRLFWSNLAGIGSLGVSINEINNSTGANISTANVRSNGDDKEFIAADQNPASPFQDNLYMVWTGNFGISTTEVYFSRSTNQGVMWSAPMQLSNNAGGEGFPWPSDVGVAQNGDVYVAYHAGGSSGAVGDTWVLRSTDGGVTFPQKNLAFAAGQSDITFNVQTAAGTIPGTQFWMQGAGQPWVLPDPARPGQVYIVNSDDPDNVHGNATDDVNIVIARSVDNGMTWAQTTVPVDVGMGSHQFFPTAAIDEAGNIIVAWYDNRNGATNGAGRWLLDVFATYSIDGGVTWSTPFQVNDPANPFDPDIGAVNRFAGPPPTTRIGEYFGIDLFGNTAHLAWNGSNPVNGPQVGHQVTYSTFAINGSLTVTGDDSGVTDDTILIRRIAGNTDFFEVLVNGQRQYAGLMEGITQITVNGLGGSDTLTVDYVNGNPIPMGGISFNGGGGAGSDSLTIQGGIAGTITHTLTSPGVGTVDIDGSMISYTGLEPVNDNMNATNRILDFGAGSDTDIRLFHGTTFVDNMVTVESPANAELVNMNTLGMASLTINTGTGDDTVRVQALDSSFNANIFVNGQDGTDTLIVDYLNGLVRENIVYDGGTTPGSDNDRLVLTGNPGSTIARETYFVDNVAPLDQGGGTWVVDPDGNTGPGVTLAPNGDETIINFSNLEPADSDIPAAVFDIIMNGLANIATLEAGGLLNGFSSMQVTDENGTFETTRFANKTTARIMGNSGADAFIIDFPDGTDVAGLTTVEVYGHTAPGVVGQPVDDDADDYFQLRATDAGVDTSLFGQGGNDLFENRNIGAVGLGLAVPLGTNDLSAINGPVNIDGGPNGALGDFIDLSDSLAGAADTNATLTSTMLTGVAPATIAYVTVETFFLALTQFDDTLDVTSTALGTQYILTGHGGGDTITIGNETANFGVNPDGSLFSDGGSLDAILGSITILPDRQDTLAGDNDIVNLDDSGTGGLFGTASITNTGAATITPSPSGSTITGDFTTLTNFAPATIAYAHSGTGGTFGFTEPDNRLEQLNVFTSTGMDTIAVNATTAVGTTRIDMHTGDDNSTMTIAGDGLSADNIFHGSAGVDQFILDILVHLGASAFVPITALEIWGDGPNLDSNNRDRLIINDNNAGFVRNLDWDYFGIFAGAMDIQANAAGAGLAGAVAANMEVNVRRMETIIFNSTGTNDLVTVTGIGVDDVITVAAVPDIAPTMGNGMIGINGLSSDTAAFVFLNGNPYLNLPGATVPGDSLAENYPGLAGGGGWPDLLIDGVSATVGIRVDGEDANNNRVVYQAASELAVDVTGGTANYWGLGAGVLLPGFGDEDAYDTININNVTSGANRVTAVNNSEGALLPIELINLGSFAQTLTSDGNPAPPGRGRPGLIVNAGDEDLQAAGVYRGDGIADDIFATAHGNFFIQVNGNLPPLGPTDVDGFPLGDQLNAAGTGAVNIWSDKETPPNVSFTFGNDPFGIQYSSIERIRLTPSNGVVNLIGDQNDPGVDQTDNFVVRGRDVDTGGSPDAGFQEMTVEINGSGPILINGVQFLNVFGFDLAGEANLNNPDVNAVDTPATVPDADDIDTLDITAYADNTPRGWGVHVNYNEGVPAGMDGAQTDLLIYNTVAANPVSENIVIQPSGPEDGDLRVTNATDGSAIVTIHYVDNLDIIVNDNDGFASDTDTLTLRGTNPDTVNASGHELITADFTADGDSNSPVVQVFDTQGTPAIGDDVLLYRLRTNPGAGPAPLTFDTISFETLGGDDVVSVVGRNDGSLTVNIDAGPSAGSDRIVVNGTFDGSDAVTVTPGAGSDAGEILVMRAAATAATTINFAGTEAIDFNGGFGVGIDTLTVNGTGGNNAFTLAGTSTLAGNVRVDSGPLIGFVGLGSGGSDLNLNGLGGDDSFAIAHVSNWQIDDVNISAGPPSASDSVQIAGTGGDDAFAYTASSINSGQIDLTAGGSTTNYILTDVESAAIDGAAPVAPASPGDTLNVTTANATITPGGNPGEGRVDPVDASGNPLLALSYRSIETAAVTGGTAVIQGTAANDTITVSAAGVVTVTNLFGFNNSVDVSGFTTLVINALGGDDSITIASSGLFAGGITVIGGDNGTGSDSVTVNDPDPNLNFTTGQITNVVGGPILLSGVEVVNLNGANGTADIFELLNYGALTGVQQVNLSGGDTDNNDGDLIEVTGANVSNTILFSPTGVSTATINRGEGGPAINISGFNNAVNRLIYFGGTGADEVQVIGTATADEVIVSQAGGATRVTLEGSMTTPFVRLSLTSVDGLMVHGNLGDDLLTVDNSGGLVTLTGGITFNGGTGNDSLSLVGTTAVATATYNVGPTDDAGNVVHMDAAGATQTVFFTGLEPVVDNVAAAALIINATNGDNAINYTQGSVAANGLVSVDGFETIEFSNKTTLVINALAGSDTINLNNPSAPTGLSGITVNAGDPTGSDTVIVNGTAGEDAITFTPVSDDSGAVTGAQPVPVSIDGAESLIINGQGSTGASGDDLTIALSVLDELILYSLDPNLPAPDGGLVAIFRLGTDLLPLAFRNLRADGSVTFADPTSIDDDQLIVLGTSLSDEFDVSAAGTVTLNGVLPVGQANVENLLLVGENGDDEFNIVGNHPYAELTVDGGNPSASDELNFTGSGAGAVTIDLDAETITEAGFGPVSYGGVEIVTITANNALTVVGTADNDTFDVTPLAAGSGRFTNRLIANIAFEYSAATSITFTGGTGGQDTLNVLGDDGADIVTSTATTVTVDGSTVTIGAGIENLGIHTLGGNDNVALTGLTLNPLVDAGAGNDLVRSALGAAVRATLLGGDGDDALFGGAGADRLEGGAGNDLMVGGGGDDFAFGGDGSDTFVWNPGDADDLFEGDEGDDTLAFAGGNGTDTYLVSSDNGRVLFQRQPGNVGVNMGGVENIVANSETIQMSGRNEVPANASTSGGFANFTYNAATGLFDIRVFVTGLAAGDILDSHIHMGIAGSNGPVVVPLGGGGGYVAVGGGLERTLTGLSLADIVPPAGFTAQDVLMEILLGRAYFNVHSPALPGGEVRGNIIVSGPTAGSGGGDSLTVRDLTGTALRSIVFDAGNEAEIRNGAPLVDTVTIEGLNTADRITAAVPNVLDNNYLVSGLPYNILVTGSDGAIANGASRDQFVLNGNGGDDELKALPAVEAVTRVTLDGGDGNDVLSADATLIGGAGNDTLIGGAGNDTMDGGAGDDIFIGNGGIDNVGGGVANSVGDTILVEGTSGADTISAVLDGMGRLVVTVNGLTTTYANFLGGPFATSGIENIRILAGDGLDVITVQALSNAGYSIRGGDPIGVLQQPVGDILNVVTGGAGFLFLPGPEADSGTVSVTGSQPVSFDEIELLQINGVNYILPDRFDDPDLVFPGNDSIGTAKVLGSQQQFIEMNLTLHDTGNGINEDFFKVTANQTGKMIFNVFFTDALGDIDIQVQDMSGDVIASSTSITDNEQIIIEVVGQQMYFMRVFSFDGVPNIYNLEIENFAAPVPDAVHLDPASDLGMMNNDNLTSDNTPRFIIQADLQDFADMGITVLTAAQALVNVNDANVNPIPGAAVEVHIISSSTGLVHGAPVGTGDVLIISGFANPIGTSNILFEFTPTIPLPDDTYFVSSAVRIFDGQIAPDANGRSPLSKPLWITIDATPPGVLLNFDLLDASDSGMSMDDYVTNKMQPAFDGRAEAGSKVRIFAAKVINGVPQQRELIGQGVTGSDSSDVSSGGQRNDGLGLFEITVEPLVDSLYDITIEVEDGAGNVMQFDPDLNTPGPVDIEIDTLAPNLPFLDLLETSDTGRHNDDNITMDNTPSISMTTTDPTANPMAYSHKFAANFKYRVFDRQEGGSEVLVFDSFAVLGDFTSATQIITTLAMLSDNYHDLKLEVEDRAGNISHDFLLDLLIDTVAPNVTIIGIKPPGDTGVPGPGNAATFNDNITSDTSAGFVGRAEADAIVRLFVDAVNNGMVDNPTQFSLTVAVPFDGDDGLPNGQWSAHYLRDLNNPNAPDFFPFDGVREVIAEAEDLAGNVNTVTNGVGDAAQMLDIFIDTQGPQVFDPDAGGPIQAIQVVTAGVPNPTFDLFDIKPTAGPTPRVDGLKINVRDFAVRDPAFFFAALQAAVVANPDLFRVVGDRVGRVTVSSVVVMLNPPVAGQPATAMVTLTFAEPLEDDRFTLTIQGLIDPVGNIGVTFTARFTVDSRAEIGVWGQAGIHIDANQNFHVDSTVTGGVDFDVSRDLKFVFGLQTDAIFAGQFHAAGGGSNGFDRLGAYGLAAGAFRFLLDFNDNGAVDGGETIISNVQVNAVPFAGDFSNDGNGDEIGLFDGVTWWLDTNGDNLLDTSFSGNMRGLPFAGDFDGDGLTDLATHIANTNSLQFDLAFDGLDGNADQGFGFGFPGVLERPFAGDFNLDGVDDVGLTTPSQTGSDGPLEWYILVSRGTPVAGNVDTLNHPFSPTPVGSPSGGDFAGKFGSGQQLPVVGNFDPPLPITAPTMGGTYVFNGRSTRVEQSGGSLTFINENGQTAAGRFLSATQVIADGWGGLTGRLVEGRIEWANGTIWTLTPTDLSGHYSFNGQFTRVEQSPAGLTFVNEHGNVSQGRFVSNTQVVASDWGNLAGTVGNGRIQWANGTTWVFAAPDIRGDYTYRGLITSVRQVGDTLTFINEAGNSSRGRFLNPTQVVATDWGGLVGNLVNGRIEWANGSVWTWTVPMIAGNYTYNGQSTGIQQSGSTLTFINEHGNVSRGTFLSRWQIVASDWGGLTGQIVNGRIEWANGSKWDSSVLDQLFADFDEWPLVA